MVSAVLIAWRLKGVAARLLLAPFGAMLLLSVVDPWLLALLPGGAASAEGVGFDALAAGYVLLDALYLGLEGVFVAMLLSALMSDRPLGETRLTLLPDGRQLRFGGAMVLVGLVAVVLHLLLRQGVAAALADLEVAALERFDTPAGRALFALVATPLLPWVVAGLAVAPLALRLLRLPALAGGARPGTAPTPGLFAFLIGAVIAAELVRRAIIGPLARLPVIGDTTAPEYVAWYVSTLVLLTLVTARVGALLMRRHRAAAIGMAGT